MTDTDQDAARFAARHKLEALRAQDPARFAALLAQVAANGAALPRLPDKEAGPAGLFSVVKK
jgi:hypothetical protein